MIQIERTTSWGEIKHDWNCGKSTSKTRSWHWTKLSGVWRIRAGEFCWPENLVEEAISVAGVGFLQSLSVQPIWKGIWPYVDPMESVCLRTASVEWNVPGKYGPHGELFFFLSQKEPESMPDSETFSRLHQC